MVLIICPICKGKGVLHEGTDHEETCPICFGEGEVDKDD